MPETDSETRPARHEPPRVVYGARRLAQKPGGVWLQK